MNSGKLVIGVIGGLGFLSSPLDVAANVSTTATVLEQDIPTENPYMINTGIDFLQEASTYSFVYNIIKNSVDGDYEDSQEIDVIAIPIVKKMLFTFKEPVKQEFV